MWGMSFSSASRTRPYSSVEAGRRTLEGGSGISSRRSVPPRRRKHSRKPLAPKKVWREGSAGTVVTAGMCRERKYLMGGMRSAGVTIYWQV